MLAMSPWVELFQSWLDVVGFVLFLLVFPIYHWMYPILVRRSPHGTPKGRMDIMRRSWIEGLVERRDILAAAQQTRNLTMMNSLLGSAALILLGMTANALLTYPKVPVEVVHPASWEIHPGAVAAKLYLLFIVFAVAFSYYMAALRRLGQFNLVVGADPAVIEAEEGSAVDYLANLINKASNRYTLGVRSFFAAFPLFAWLFDPWLFLGITIFFAGKFVGFQDFSRILGRRRT
jgi:uncharacterized membrane protein